MTKQILDLYVKKGKLDFKALKLSKRKLQRLKRIIFVGSGRAYSSALSGKSSFETLTDVLISAYPSGEFRFSPTYVDAQTLLFAISHTGEENDTIASIKRVKAIGGRVISVCNKEDSTVAKMADANLNPLGESFECDSFVLSLLAIYIGSKVGMVTPLYQSVALKMAEMLSAKCISLARYTRAVEEARGLIAESSGVIACGRGGDYAIAVELENCGAMQACYISELAFKNLENKIALAIISSKDYLSDTLFYLNNASNNGAVVLVLTTDEIAEEINDMNGIIAFSGSLPIFNVTLLSSIASIILEKDSEFDLGYPA